MLRGLGGLEGLATATASSLAIHGMGPVRSTSLLAALEIGRRLARMEVPERDPMSHPAAVANYLQAALLP